MQALHVLIVSLVLFCVVAGASMTLHPGGGNLYFGVDHSIYAFLGDAGISGTGSDVLMQGFKLYPYQAVGLYVPKGGFSS